PLGFLSGVTGAFFKALSITMAAGLFISFLITWLAVPILADRLLTEKDAGQEEGGRITTWMHARYAGLLGLLLRYPALVLVLLAPLLIMGWIAFRGVGSGFMPAMDEGGFVLDYRSAPGTALSETDRLLRQGESNLIGDLTAVPQPVEIKLFADNPAQLPSLAQGVADRIAKIPGIVSVLNGINPAGDALMIHVARVKAAMEGMDADAVTKLLSDNLSGTVTTQIAQGVKMVGVRVWIPPGQRSTDRDVDQLNLRAPDGHLVPL